MILEVARSLFFRGGFEGTSMDAVAEAAGVSKTTVYSHFGDKDGLFREVIAGEPGGPPGSPPGPPGDPVEVEGIEGLRVHLAMTGIALVGMLSSPEVHERTRLLIHHATRDTKMARLFFESAPEAMQRSVAGLLAIATADGYLSVPDPMAAADQLLSMWMGLHNLKQQLGLVGPRTVQEVDRHARSCVEMFLRAYATGRP